MLLSELYNSCTKSKISHGQRKISNNSISNVSNQNLSMAAVFQISMLNLYRCGDTKTFISSSMPGIQFSSNQIKQGKAVVQGQIFYVTYTGSFLRIICSRKQCLALFLFFISSNRFSRQFFHQIKDCKLQQKIKFREINTSQCGP